MRHFLFFFFLIIGTLVYSQGNVPLHNLRHASGPDFIIRSSQNGQAQWIKDTIYFPKVYTVASTPITAKKGDFWRSTANGNTYLWDGVTWQLIAKMDGDTSSINELIQSVSYADGFLNIEDNGGTYTVDLRDTLFGTIDTTGLVALIRNVAPLTDSIAWSNVKNKPLTFTPSTHTHVIGEVTGLQDSLNLKASTNHTHTIANITNLQDSLNTRVRSVTASTPLSSSGGVTPNITIQNATTSLTGALTSTDWNTFNNKFTLPSLTSGSVLFSNGSTIAQDNSNFFWDNTNKNLGIGTNNPNSLQGWGRVLQVNNPNGNGASISLKDSGGEFSIASYVGGLWFSRNSSPISFFIGSTGNTGIGTTTPSAKLHIVGGDFWNQAAGGSTIKFIDGQAIRASSTLFFDTETGDINFRPSFISSLTLKANGRIISNTIPSYASTAAAAADGGLTAGSFFKVTNGNGTSALHVKD